MRRKRLDWKRSDSLLATEFRHGDGVAHLADCRQFAWPERCSVVVFDPPWDDEEAWGVSVPKYDSLLAFCDGKYAASAISRFGPPKWIFVWDTMSTWSTTKNAPLNGCKFCFLYGEAEWKRDAAIYGDPPPKKAHPSTAYEPLAGRRLSDLFRKSLRWQSNANASGASDRPPHTKPDEWVSALVLGCGQPGGTLCDPFMGGGSSLVAAKNAGMNAVATEKNKDVFSWACSRLSDRTDADSGGDSLPLFAKCALH